MSIGMRPSFGSTGQNRQQGVAGYQQASLSRLSPEQMQLFKSLLGGSMQGLQGGLGNLSGLASGDQSQFAALEAPAMRQFGQLQSGIANRFSTGGGAQKYMSGLRGSGHANYQSAAATDFAERLQGQRMGLQQNAIQQLMQLSQGLLGTQTQENFLVEPKRPTWEKLLGAGLPILGGAVGGAFGGPAGAYLGASAGSAAGRSFF